MSDYSALSNNQLDMAYAASFDVGDHVAMDAYAQEIITREQSFLNFGAAFLGVHTFPMYDARVNTKPQTPGLNQANTPTAPGFSAVSTAQDSVGAAAVSLENTAKSAFSFAALGVGGLLLVALGLFVVFKFK